jgi:sugar phosphate isomerase/epimerase
MAATGLGIQTAGLQLYTLRSIMNDDLEGNFRRIAEIGYKELEFAGYYDRTPQEIRAILDENGFTAPSTHISSAQFRNSLDKIIEDAKIIGHEYVICPHPGDEPFETLDDYRAMAEFFNEVGMKCQEAGLKFGYHNHSFEFEEIDGVVPYDILLEETDPELVPMQLDLCWIVNAGKDPVAYFEKHPGRFHLCHVKDLDANGELANVGSGTIDFARIFASAPTAGLKHYIVEHDRPGDDPFESIRVCYNYLTG